ncbi:MAG: NAD(P)H-binding protein, partial [Solirubrobacteraceae bacterium]
ARVAPAGYTGPVRALVAGATGFIGTALTERLLSDGADVRALVRSAGRTRHLPADAIELHEGDVLEPETLAGAGEGVDVAYYLVHSMGRGGGGGDFEQRERRAAEAFARMCAEAHIGRVVYLGGLGDKPGSKHLRSRHNTALALAEHGPPLTYFRASMVVGAGSESYRTLRHLVARLPVMITPRWLSTPTQPIDIDDVVAYLAAALWIEGSRGREIQIGGPDVLPYAQMLDRMAVALGKRPRPKLPVPLLTPWLSSLWIGLVTPVDAQVARPLIEGLATETVVTDPSGAALFDIEPIGFDASLRKAVAAERGAVAA